ncbi:MAG: ornithine cyclodeaminase family protein, partial [Actinocatenispora sp.]
ELGLPARAAPSAEVAIRERDVVVLATSSGVPVVDPAWLSPGTSVTTLGPKQRGRSEFGAALADRAGLLVTDSLDQVAGYDPPFVLAGTPAAGRLRSLGALLAGDVTTPSDPATIRMYCSVGLAGTEPALLAAVLAGARPTDG